MPEQCLGAGEAEFTLTIADPDIAILKQAKAEYGKLRYSAVENRHL